MPNELLIEVGLEELPASFLKQALSSIEAAAHELLAGARLTPTSIEVLGSPRRIALRVRGLPERQPDRQEVVQGPPWAAAFDDAGVPKNGAVGFAKKQGVPVESLIAVETERGKYVAANVFEPGQEAKAVLPELLHTLCGRISFPKSMRWGEGTFAFGRPVHWLVGLFGAYGPHGGTQHTGSPLPRARRIRPRRRQRVRGAPRRCPRDRGHEAEEAAHARGPGGRGHGGRG